jgi:hypothetical protein
LVVLTYPGGPVSLFSMIPLRNLKLKTKTTQRSLLQNSYLEKIGLTGAIDAVKRKRVRID